MRMLSTLPFVTLDTGQLQSPAAPHHWWWNNYTSPKGEGEDVETKEWVIIY